MTHTHLTKSGTKARTFTQLLGDEQGATAIEYGLIAALIAVAAIQSMSLLGGTLVNTFTAVNSAMISEGADSPTPLPDFS